MGTDKKTAKAHNDHSKSCQQAAVTAWKCGVCGKEIKGTRFTTGLDIIAHIRMEKRKKKRKLEPTSGKWVPASGVQDSY